MAQGATQGEGSAFMRLRQVAPMLDVALALLYALAHLLFFSTLANAILPGLDRLALLAMALAIACAITLAAWRGCWLAAGLAIAALGLVAVQLVVFSHLAQVPVNWNAGLSYTVLAGFIVFFNARHHLSLILRILVALAIAYCAAYALFADRLVELGGLGTQVLDGDNRGPRLVLANGYAALAVFACLVRLKSRPVDWRWLGPLALVLLALLEAQSRTFSVLAAMVAAFFLLGLLSGMVRWALAFIFTLLLAVVLSGAALPDWNPFGFFAFDPSGQVRAGAYALFQPYLADNPLTGIGLPPDRAAFEAFLGRPYVFWEDLGALGIWAGFGAWGLIAFLLLAYRSIFGIPVRGPDEMAVSLAALTAALFGILSPTLWSGSASLLANLVVASCLAHRQAFGRPLDAGDELAV